MAVGKKTGGRVKGTPNKTTASAREAFQHAFNGIGGAQALTNWARENQTEFYKLFGRLIPVEHSGEGGGPVQHAHKVIWGNG